MAYKVLLPQFGMGMQDGRLVQWFKSVGDRVVEGEPLCEIEAAKTIAEVPSPVSGILSQIIVQVDGEAQVREPIAIIETGEDSQPLEQIATPLGKVDSNASASQSAILAESQSIRTNVQIEPRARRLAESQRLDLAGVRGSGPNGRITEEDVNAAIAGVNTSGVSEFEDVPISGMRRIIAERLTHSKQTIPHFYMTSRCRMDSLMVHRQRANEGNGDRLSITAYLIYATARALAANPDVNVSWRETAIRKHRNVDIAVAVATKAGVITPVIKEAAEKSVADISAEMKTLTHRARQGALRPDEYQGGSFTISNLGMYGVHEFSAIINPPQAGILAVGETRATPVIVSNQIVAAMVMVCTFAFDHRVVDGAAAGKFTTSLSEIIESAKFT